MSEWKMVLVALVLAVCGQVQTSGNSWILGPRALTFEPEACKGMIYPETEGNFHYDIGYGDSTMTIYPVSPEGTTTADAKLPPRVQALVGGHTTPAVAILRGDLEPHYSYEIKRYEDGTWDIQERDPPYESLEIELPAVPAVAESIERIRVVDPTSPTGFIEYPGLPADLDDATAAQLLRNGWTCKQETDQTRCWQ